MKRMILIIGIVSILSMANIVYAAEVSDFISVPDEFHGYQLTAEIVSNGGIAGVVTMKESGLLIDNDGTLFCVETWNGKNQIWVYDRDYNYYHGCLASAKNEYKIQAISFDNFGNMFCVLTKIVENQYPSPPGITSRLVVVKISGFSSLQDQLDGLNYRIDNDIAAVQQQIDEIKSLLEQLPQLKNK